MRSVLLHDLLDDNYIWIQRDKIFLNDVKQGTQNKRPETGPRSLCPFCANKVCLYGSL